MSTKRCDIAGSDKARQQRTRQLDRQRHPYAVAVARRDVDRRTFGVLHALQRDLEIAGGMDDFDAVADGLDETDTTKLMMEAAHG